MGFLQNAANMAKRAAAKHSITGPNQRKYEALKRKVNARLVKEYLDWSDQNYAQKLQKMTKKVTKKK